MFPTQLGLDFYLDMSASKMTQPKMLSWNLKKEKKKSSPQNETTVLDSCSFTLRSEVTLQHSTCAIHHLWIHSRDLLTRDHRLHSTASANSSSQLYDQHFAIYWGFLDTETHYQILHNVAQSRSWRHYQFRFVIYSQAVSEVLATGVRGGKGNICLRLQKKLNTSALPTSLPFFPLT